MAKTMKVLVGNFTFLEDLRDGVDEVLVHEGTKVIDVPDDYDLELLLEEYEGYLVPSLYRYVISYDSDELKSEIEEQL